MMRWMRFVMLAALLSGCGVAYISSDVTEETTNAGIKVRVVPLTADTTAVANRSSYAPRPLPAELRRGLAPRGTRTADAPPAPVFEIRPDRETVQARLPDQIPQTPYMIGVGDVLLFASPSSASTLEQLSGLLAAQNARQGYTVQDDGSVAIPNVGRVPVAGLSLDEAEAALFERLVDAGMEPAFSIEIAEFGSKSVSVGGAVARPSVLPVGLTAPTLGEALLGAGGVAATDLDDAVVRLYRDGELYQVPASDLYARPSIQDLRLKDRDSIYVDTTFDLRAAQAYFEERIRLSEFRRAARAAQLAELQAEVNLQRAAIDSGRAQLDAALELGAIDRDYVYLTGEVERQTRVPLPFETRATLADVLYAEGGFSARNGNPSHIYVLRGSDAPSESAGLTAYNLDARSAANLLLATRFEMRPNDIVFIAEQPVTRWNRAVSLIIPSIVTAAATGN